MPWDRVDDSPSVASTDGKKYRQPSTSGYNGHGVATKTTALVTWRCRGCRKLAVTGGDDPGRCLFRGCPYCKG